MDSTNPNHSLSEISPNVNSNGVTTLKTSNENVQEADGIPQLQRSKSHGGLGTTIEHFSLIWFTIAMDTGVLGIIMHQLPYQFNGLHVISTIMFVLELVLFFLFGICYMLRWVLYPQETYHAVCTNVEEVALMAAPVIAYLILVGQIALICSNAWGYHFTMLAYVLWWIGLVSMLMVCSSLFIYMIKKPSAALIDEDLPVVIFIPIVGLDTIGTMGGLIANFAVGISDRLAVPMIIVGFMSVGYALLFALVIYAIYLHRLTIGGWPPAEKIPGVILTVGALGQSASALQQLGAAANQKHDFAGYHRGSFLEGPAAATVQVICTLLALLLIGFAIFWICVAYFAIIEGLWQKRLHPGLSWWSTIFPMGTVNTACISLSSSLDSPAFRGLAAGLLVFLVLCYIGNIISSAMMIWKGQLLGLSGRHSWLTVHREREHRWLRSQKIHHT